MNKKYSHKTIDHLLCCLDSVFRFATIKPLYRPPDPIPCYQLKNFNPIIMSLLQLYQVILTCKQAGHSASYLKKLNKNHTLTFHNIYIKFISKYYMYIFNCPNQFPIIISSKSSVCFCSFTSHSLFKPNHSD